METVHGVRWGLLLGVGVALAGCGSAGRLSENGDLGNGTFTYQCVSQGDNECSGGNPLPGTTTPFPSAVALGSRFSLAFAASSSVGNVGNPVLTPTSPDYLKDTGTGLLTLQPGLAGVFAASSIDDTFVDYTLIQVVQPLGLQVTDSTGSLVTTAAELVPVSSQAAFTVVAIGESSTELAGTLDATWTTSDATVASLSLVNPNNAMQIAGVKAGTATIGVASAGGVRTTFSVEVE